MTRYISGISIIRFASFLAWTGLVISLIFIIGSLDIILTPLALGIHHRYSAGCSSYTETLCGSLYGAGIGGLIMNIGMFVYSFKLWKAINSDNMMGVRNLIKIGCYIMGALELLTCAASAIITPIHIALISLMIHGVRKFKPGLLTLTSS